MLPDRPPHSLQLVLDLGQPLDIVGVRDELALVLLVRLACDLCLATEVVLGCELGLLCHLVGAAEVDHGVLERLTLLLKRGTLGFDLAMKLRVLRAGGGEVGREGVKAFADVVDFELRSHRQLPARGSE